MQSTATSVEQYLAELPDERRPIISKLRAIILENLPPGFEEQMSYGMIGYVVPFSKYPLGYHCTPNLPLPFMNIASQKNFIALYHMSLYADEKLHKWFTDEFAKTGWKLDMGKACIRFKNPEKIPYQLIAELCKKITVDDWVNFYKKNWDTKRNT